jgi:hypothetical protein
MHYGDHGAGWTGIRTVTPAQFLKVSHHMHDRV